jgi:hypothetical protein
MPAAFFIGDRGNFALWRKTVSYQLPTTTNNQVLGSLVFRETANARWGLEREGHKTMCGIEN